MNTSDLVDKNLCKPGGHISSTENQLPGCFPELLCTASDATENEVLDYASFNYKDQERMSRSVPSATECFNSTVFPAGTYRARSGSQSSFSSQSLDKNEDPSLNFLPSATYPRSVSMATNLNTTLGIERNALMDIRAQIAASVKHLKALEEQVKTIPLLKLKLSDLEKENRVLLERLAKTGKNNLFSLKSSEGSFNESSDFNKTADNPNSSRHDIGRGIVLPNLQSNNIDESKPASRDYLTISKYLKSQARTALHREHHTHEDQMSNDASTKRKFRSIGVQSTVMTENNDVDCILERAKSVGVSASLQSTAICRECMSKVASTSPSSSETKSESELDNQKLKFGIDKSVCFKCNQNINIRLANKGVNTELSVDDIKTKLESVKQDKLEITNEVSNMNIVPLRSACLTCEVKVPEVKIKSLSDMKTVSHVAVNTAICMNDLLNYRETECRKPVLLSRAVDPIVWPKTDVCVQHDCPVLDVGCDSNQITMASSSVQTEDKLLSTQYSTVGVDLSRITDMVCDKCIGIVRHHAGVEDQCVTKDICEKHIKSNGTCLSDVRNMFCNLKTADIGVGDSSILDSFCVKCEQRQTESISIGDGDASEVMSNKCKHNRTSDTKSVCVSTDLALSVDALRVCDKCNAAIESVAKEFVDNIQVQQLPLASYKPRPIMVTVSVESTKFGSQSLQASGSSVTDNTSATDEKWHSQVDTVESSSVEGIPVCLDQSGSDTESSSSDFENSVTEVPYSDIIRQAEAVYMKTFFENCDTLQPVSRQRSELSKEVKSACKVLNDYLTNPGRGGGKLRNLKTSLSIIEKEWFRISGQKTTDPLVVEDYIDIFEEFSHHLLSRVVNLTDENGNTAMHYAVSNGNLDVVSVLLESKVCDLNKQNKAGYTCVMVAALTELQSEAHRHVMRKLLHLADVNIKATQNGQTALMLAVSHRRLDMVEALLGAGAAVNLQDEEGSTALMCAAEHGFVEITKLLLASADCDASIKDNDGIDALTIAMEAGHRDVALLIYTNINFYKGNSNHSIHRRLRHGSVSSSTTPLTSPFPSPGMSRKFSTSLS